MLELSNTRLNGVLKIYPPTRFFDDRGDYVEIYNEQIYNESGINIKFIQDDISISKRHVLRGIHGDQETWKLISCLYGSFYLIVVNNDMESTEYKLWDHFIMRPNSYQILIPPKFGNGHVVLSDYGVFHYKQSTYYNRSKQFTIKWNDPDFEFYWPVKNPILSKRDNGTENV